MNATEILLKLQKVTVTKEGWSAACPAHEDNNASLSIAEKNGKTLLHCHAGCKADEICRKLNITLADLFTEKRNGNGRHIVATYDYTDADGKLSFQAVRFDPKGFLQRQPDGKGGWIWNLKGIDKPVLFHLPAVINAPNVIVAEGEKDVLAIERQGLVATCNPMGAGKWREWHSDALRGKCVCIISDKDAPGKKHAQEVAQSLQGKAKFVSVVELPDVNGHTVKDAADYFAAGGTKEQFAAIVADAEWNALQEMSTIVDNQGQARELAKVESEKPNLLEKLRARLFNPANKPPEQEPRYTINGVAIATVGNLGAISGPPKVGKSAVVASYLASTFASDGADCLSIQSSNPEGKAVLHLDTEQSIEDHWNLLTRTLVRAGADKPDWLQPYCLTGFTIKESQLAVSILMADCAERFGGVHSVFLDGVADLVQDVNDPEESNLFVNHLHSLAIQYACPIIGVIHLNPGTEKTRGHLGSQLERKAETNLKIERDGDAFILWADKNRRAPITKDRGPRFAWSDEMGMHVSVESAADLKQAELIEEYTPMVQELFADTKAYTHSKLVSGVMTLIDKSEETAKRRIKEWCQIGLIRKTPQNFYVSSI